MVRPYPAILLGSLAEGKVILTAGSGNLDLVSRETGWYRKTLIRAAKEIHDLGPVVLAMLLVLL